VRSRCSLLGSRLPALAVDHLFSSIRCPRAVERGLIEREAESRLLVLAALCGEHLLLLGPPGTAKSALSRQLSSALRAPYFERQLTRFSVPEELFGPLSLTELQQDRYVRKTDGYLPSCSIAFIDEIFKANSAILNSLLTIINEREFDNGNVREPVPLICLVGASNEPPDDDELDALYDRFLLRRYVRPVSREARPGLLEVQKQHRDTAEDAEGICSFTAMEVKDLKATAMATVTIPADVKQLIEDL
jgi:MoxR-like ATPase